MAKFMFVKISLMAEITDAELARQHGEGIT
jgi:hypothetical protein